MKNIYIFILIFVLSNIYAQDTFFLSIADENMSLEDFMKTYYKNRLDTDTLSFEESLEEYLSLYINFKLKVVEAKKSGLDTLPSFIRELDGYRRQLVKPYLTETEISDQLLEEAYERLKYEISASHILIQVDGNDTLKAYNKTLDIINKINNGQDFIKLAKEFSDDPSVKENNGNLGYFSSLYMLYPFENAAYNTKINSISDPVKTRYGYHIVKVNDKRKSRGEVKVAHIMIRTDNKKDETLFRTKIYEIYDSLIINSGVNFGELAKQYSDDKKSGSKGGELDWFGTNKMVKSFEDAAFALDSIGDFSEPFETEFGWHIVKLLDKKALPEFDEIKAHLKKKIERDSRSQKTRSVLINRLKTEWHFVENNSAKNLFYKIINESFLKGFNILEKIDGNGQIMFIFNNCYSNIERYVYQKDFADYLISYRERFPKNTNFNLIIDEFYKTFVEQKILELETKNLESKYVDFRLLMDEYHDGILLFNLSEEKVWNKAIQDTLGLASFYQKNKNNYLWSNRVSLRIYNSKNESINNKVYQNLNWGTSDSNLLKKMNRNSVLNLSIEEGVFEKGDDDFIDECISDLDWNVLKKGDILFCENTNKIALVLDLLNPSVKSLHEIKGLVISDYQAFLEEEWLKELKLKYPVKINKNLLLLAKQNKFNQFIDADNSNKENCKNFSSCFSQAGKNLGYSKDVHFGLNNKIYTTELKPQIGDDK